MFSVRCYRTKQFRYLCVLTVIRWTVVFNGFAYKIQTFANSVCCNFLVAAAAAVGSNDWQHAIKAFANQTHKWTIGRYSGYSAINLKGNFRMTF